MPDATRPIRLLTALLVLALLAGCSSQGPAGSDGGARAPRPTLTRAPVPTPWQDPGYPNKPITLIIPAAPGSDEDALARSFADFVQQKAPLPQPLVLENVPGAGGLTGLAQVAARPGDGYVFAVAGHEIVTAALQSATPLSDQNFTPIAGLAADEYVLVVPTGSKIQSAQDLVTAARAQSGQVRANGGAPGSVASYCVASLESAAQARFSRVALAGPDDIRAALADGRVDWAAVPAREAVALAKGGQARVVAGFGFNRLAVLPDVPALREQNLPVICQSQLGFVAPAGIAGNARQLLEDALAQYIHDLSFKEYCDARALTQGFMRHEDYASGLEQATNSYYMWFGP